MKTIEQTIASAFSSSLGQQCDSLYSTSDNRVFIRYEEALKHTRGELDKDTKPLTNTTILEWFEEWERGAILPKYYSFVVDNPTEHTDIDNTIQSEV